MLFSFAGCNVEKEGQSENEEYSYLAIDINPSIELIVDGETVVKVKATNEDGAILLSGENFEGQKVELVTEGIVDLAEELGYLTTENDGVKITVSADSEAIGKKLEEIAKRGAEKASEFAKVNFVPRNADERKVKELQAQDMEAFKNLTPAKLRLIEAIMVYDSAMTYEKGAGMKVCELADTLEECADKYEDIIGDELEEAFEEQLESIKEQAQLLVAGVYGDEYKADYVRYLKLKKLEKEIELKAKGVTLKEEHKKEIFDKLNETVPEGNKPHEKPNTTGWTVEDYDEYLDRHFHDKHGNKDFEDMKEAIEDILDAYDEDEYLLTDEDLASIQEIYAEPLQVENLKTLEDLDEFLDEEEDRLEEWRQELYQTLDPVQKELIKGYQETLNGAFDAAHKQMKLQMGMAKANWQKMKQERRQNYGQKAN